MLMCEVFGVQNFLSCAVWQKRVSPDTDEPFATNTHDYLIAYGKNKAFSVFNRLARTEEADAQYLNPDGNSMWLRGCANRRVANVSKSDEDPI
jgi:adenine-specific DNA-methyltransferase